MLAFCICNKRTEFEYTEKTGLIPTEKLNYMYNRRHIYVAHETENYIIFTFLFGETIRIAELIQSNKRDYFKIFDVFFMGKEGMPPIVPSRYP